MITEMQQRKNEILVALLNNDDELSTRSEIFFLLER